NIFIQNGSISHIQLLDTLPNEKSRLDSDVALKILKATLFVYNSKCVSHGINDDDCRAFLENKSLPDCTLHAECDKLLHSERHGHHAFRRLLPRHYKDGFHEVSGQGNDVPAAWSISMALYDRREEAAAKARSNTNTNDNRNLNLVLVQFAQFVEHDLSKPVSQSMSNGAPIECCNRNQNNLQPRFNHPLCAPILSKDKYGFPNCLNYVRSALAVGQNCNFGAAEQLNQATGFLDLSQLYGFTAAAALKMRTLNKGTLKSTSNGDLLPLATSEDGHSFCAWGSSENATTCFAAGDSRVNNNPYSILAYTIFMRNHNRIAAELAARHKSWDDEKLFHAAKSINIDIYRRIIMDEWLTEVLGAELAAEVHATKSAEQAAEVSNEVGVAAIRFYLSMLPNVLHNLADNEVQSARASNNVLPLTNLFELEDEIYKPQLEYTKNKLNEILKSLIHERAMKMDASYVGAVSISYAKAKYLELTPKPLQIVWHEKTKPTHADVLAFDIQRGRDHGLQPYYKYLQICSNTTIDSWSDYETYIPRELVDKLKSVYKNWSDVDLIIGGIAERTVNSTIGPTFSCILAEQFAKIHQRHQQQHSPANAALLDAYSSINGSKLLCLNSNVEAVPRNIFRLQSNR
ncbi:Irc, partial [Drosophila busckii]